jgi:hypothetical protein
MLISDIYKPGNIKIHLESEDKEELFEELVNYLVDVEKYDNRDEIMEKLWERERKMTTGIAPQDSYTTHQVKNDRSYRWEFSESQGKALNMIHLMASLST